MTFVDVFVGRELSEALKTARDAKRITTQLGRLLRAHYLDPSGRIPESLRLTNVAGLHLAITELVVEGLTAPVYFLEATNSRYDLAHPQYVRYFTFDTAANRLECQRPAEGKLLHLPNVTGWRPLCSEGGGSAEVEPLADDPSWFIRQPTRAETIAQVMLPGVSAYQTVKRYSRANHVHAHLQQVVRTQLCAVGSEFQVSPDGYYAIGKLQFWVTPLQTHHPAEFSAPGRTLLHHIVVVNTALAKDDPIRAVAFLYDGGSTELFLLMAV